TKIRVWTDVLRQDHRPPGRVDTDIEFAKISELGIQRRVQRMVKDIIKVCAPGTGPNERVASSHVRVIKNIRARWRQTKSSWVKELVAGHALIGVADYSRTERRSREVSDRINKSAGDIT